MSLVDSTELSGISVTSSVNLPSAHLHQQLAVLQAGDAAFTHNCGDVVLVVRESIQRECCIVLQVAVFRRHELQQRRQAARLQHIATFKRA